MTSVLDRSFVTHIDGPMVFGDDACMPIDRASTIETIEVVDESRPFPDPWRCPACGSAMRVLDKRNADGYVHRRRICVSCPTRMTTHETVQKIHRNVAMPAKWIRERE